MNSKAKDFIFSFVLFALGVFVVVSGFSIYQKAALIPYKVTEFTLSPGFMPVVLGFALVFCSIVLCLQSLKSEEGMGATAKKHFAEFKAWVKPAFTNEDTITMAIGIVIMFIYSYFLVGFLPYIVASAIFLIGMMFFLRAAKWWKIIVISLVAVGLIYLLFKVCFNAALP